MVCVQIVPLLSNFPHTILSKISDVLELEVYKAGDYIVREGTSGDTFYILSEGEVKITKKTAGKEEEIRSLTKGDYFGEQVGSSSSVHSSQMPSPDCSVTLHSTFRLVGSISSLFSPQCSRGSKSVLNQAKYSVIQWM